MFPCYSSDLRHQSSRLHLPLAHSACCLQRGVSCLPLGRSALKTCCWGAQSTQSKHSKHIPPPKHPTFRSLQPSLYEHQNTVDLASTLSSLFLKRLLTPVIQRTRPVSPIVANSRPLQRFAFASINNPLPHGIARPNLGLPNTMDFSDDESIFSLDDSDGYSPVAVSVRCCSGFSEFPLFPYEIRKQRKESAFCW